MSKLVVIIGITGNQGSSVAHSFLHSPTPWRIRGLTRSPSSPTSLHLSSLGIEMVYADLHNPSTLRTAFHGASLIFSVTDFWAPFFNPSNAALARSRGVEIGRLAYELEYDQGKNVVDAAAREVEGLDEVGFVASTLCHAGEASGGRYEQLYHFDAKADVFPKYVAREYPALAAKMSFLHTGYFYSSWRMVPQRWLAKVPNTAEYQMQFPTHPDTLIPHLHPREDTGKFVQTLLTLPPGSTLMAASEWCTWPDWIKQWGEVTGMKTSYKQISVQEMDETIPGGAGKEFGEMYEFSSEYGYNASQKDTIMTWDLEKMGIHVPTVSLKEYIRSVDWVKEGIIDR